MTTWRECFWNCFVSVRWDVKHGFIQSTHMHTLEYSEPREKEPIIGLSSDMSCHALCETQKYYRGQTSCVILPPSYVEQHRIWFS